MTPIFVTAVTPLKTGKSVLEVEAVRVVADLQPTTTRMTLRMLHRDERAIIATGESWRGDNDLFAITPLDMEWLGRFNPRLVERYALHAWRWYSGDEPTNASEYLEHVFGIVPERMSGLWVEGEPWPDLLIDQPRAFMPYRREWRGMDAWLMLRPEIPDSMDDKWIIRAVDHGPTSILSFRRSWNNFPWYELVLNKISGRVTVEYATVSLNERERSFGTPEQESAVLDWLIDNFLLARRRDPLGIFDFAHGVQVKKAWTANQKAAGLVGPVW